MNNIFVFFLLHINFYAEIKVIPKGPPHIKDVPAEFSIGQWVNLNCTSDPSRPPARLTWIVNHAEVETF